MKGNIMSIAGISSAAVHLPTASKLVSKPVQRPNVPSSSEEASESGAERAAEGNEGFHAIG